MPIIAYSEKVDTNGIVKEDVNTDISPYDICCPKSTRTRKCNYNM